jgi:4-aminobutyrate aminotransferase
LTYKAECSDKLVESSQPGTFAANSLSAAVCLTNIDILTDRNQDLMGRATMLGEQTLARLRKETDDIRIIGDVRGRGLFIGVELVKDRETKEPLSEEAMGGILGALLGAGVIAVPCGRYHNVIRYMPPLVITQDYLDRATDILLDICRKQG